MFVTKNLTKSSKSEREPGMGRADGMDQFWAERVGSGIQEEASLMGVHRRRGVALDEIREAGFRICLWC